MNFWTAERIATIETALLVDNLCDFTLQASRMAAGSELRARSVAAADRIKAELIKRAA